MTVRCVSNSCPMRSTRRVSMRCFECGATLTHDDKMSIRNAPRYWALVVKRDGQLKRTTFAYGRVTPMMFDVARENGWTPVACVGIRSKDLLRLGKEKRGLVAL